MTPTDEDLTIIRPLAALSLVIRDPSGGTRCVPLASGRMLIGRGADCSLILEAADSTASRHHAVITVDGPVVMVEDAGSANGVFVNENKVERAMLRPGDVARLGRTTLVVTEAAGAAPSPPPSPEKTSSGHGRPGGRSRKRLVLILVVLLVAMCLIFWLALFSGGKRPPAPAKHSSSTSAAPVVESLPGKTGVPAEAAKPTASETGKPAAAPATPKAGGAGKGNDSPGDAKTSPESVEQSQEHARQAQFFYNSGKIGRAIDEWEKALALDPGNSQAAKWLARAEGERDQLLDKYYREGLTALKYSRFASAMENFHFVVEHCREKTDERCLDAARQLEQLEGKKQ